MSKTVRVPHLGGIDVGYRMAKPFKASKPSLVAITGLTWGQEGYTHQLNDEALSDALNIIVIDALGNGQTNARATDTWTYWDSALMALQAMDALGVRKAFVLGASSGGFIAARMALYSPDVILGLILVGTGLDSESPHAFENGNMNGGEWHKQIFEHTAQPNDNWEPPKDYGANLCELSLGQLSNEGDRKQVWTDVISKNYTGNAGRKRMRQTWINMHDRDSLLNRLSDIRSPTLWLQGEQDKVFSIKNAQEEIKLFTSSPDANLETLSGGHLLQSTNSAEFNKRLGVFAAKYSDKPDARKLREAVGMIDI